MGLLSSIGKVVGKVAGIAGGVLGGPFGGVISSAAGSLLDDKLTRDRESSARAYQDPMAIRRRFEAAGFNPTLAFTGNGAGTIAPSVGQSATASSLIAAALDRNSDEKIAKAQLEQENRRLEMMAEELALKAQPRQAFGRGAIGGGAAANAETGGTVPPLQGPAYPGPQQGPAPADDPTEILRGDNLTSATGAGDGPVEAEGDLWAWARNGTLSRNIDEVLARNFGDFWRMDQNNSDGGNTLIDRWKNQRRRANQELDKGRSRRRSITHPVLRGQYPGHMSPGF